MRATGTVDLPLIRSHRRYENAVTRLDIARQILGFEIQALGAAASHQIARNRSLHRGPRRTPG